MSLLGISLIHGWAPITAQIITPITLGLAAGWRSRRWRLLWLPAAAVIGVMTAPGRIPSSPTAPASRHRMRCTCGSGWSEWRWRC